MTKEYGMETCNTEVNVTKLPARWPVESEHPRGRDVYCVFFAWCETNAAFLWSPNSRPRVPHDAPEILYMQCSVFGVSA